MSEENQQIVFFDGVCVLCNGFVDFLISKNVSPSLKFASLQGETAKRLFPQKVTLESLVFYDKGTFLYQSSAVLEIVKYLPVWWKPLLIFFVVPKNLRDAVYRYVARNRYQLFGQRDSCRLPEGGDSRILP